MLAEPKDSRTGHLGGGGSLRGGAAGASARDNDGPEMGAGRKEAKRLGESDPEREVVGEIYFRERSRTTSRCLDMVWGVQPMGAIAAVRNGGHTLWPIVIHAVDYRGNAVHLFASLE